MSSDLKAKIAAAANQALKGKNRKARASHILVRHEDKALELKAKLDSGEKFAKLARAHSNCPSKKNGGDLGEFGPGQMVPAFDKAVFSASPNTVVGPIKTKFGYHIIWVQYFK
ncbi:peptidylprolyl isomerase [Salinibius halmophilus]|uniref:peptidylprolyl isomerase n=1 Tax=Salinibius halmophilus TaxID=1853216 RepID=UPI000E6721D2|nr:peptidylprolyl isomerase [Salinibius halmophilus]